MSGDGTLDRIPLTRMRVDVVVGEECDGTKGKGVTVTNCG